MMNIADKILTRLQDQVGAMPVYTVRDFLDVGSRDAVDQALTRLVKDGSVLRVGRGLYAIPRFNALLQRRVPFNPDVLVVAIARRDNLKVMPGGLTAAHRLGLTNAVPAKVEYATDGASRVVEADGWQIQLRHTPPRIMRWADRPAGVVVQALNWLGKDLIHDSATLAALGQRLPDVVKQDLATDMGSLPGWMVGPVSRLLQTQVGAG
jgi:hypothetical protein